MELKAGDRAPSFDAVDQEGKAHRLDDYRGRWVLLYFYPRDNTSGCTREACAFRDAYAELKQKATILGVSADSQKSHKGFAEKYSLPFALLSDPERKIIAAYGADGVIRPKRSSFLISPAGEVVKVYDKVKPDTHPDEVLADLSRLEV